MGTADERVKIAALSTLRTVGQRDPGTIIPILEKALNAEKEQKIKRSIVATLDGLKKTGQAREKQMKKATSRSMIAGLVNSNGIEVWQKQRSLSA